MQTRLSGSDAFMLLMETPRAYHHTFKVAILDPSTDPEGWSFERYREDFKKRIHRIPFLRWKYLSTPLGLNHPIWVEDPDFDLDYHLRRVGCPAPGDHKALCEFMSSVYAYQLDRSRPLWLNWVVEGVAGGKIAMVTLVHHAYVDGVGASHALQQLYSYGPGWVPETQPPWRPGKLPSWGARLWWGVRDWPQVVLGTLPKVIRGITQKRKLERELAASGKATHPTPAMMQKTPLNQALSPGRTFVCGSLELADFKAISKGFGVTINDVFLACTAGAKRRYLQDKGYDPDRQASIAGVPFGLERPDGREGLGNYITKDFTWIHTEIEDPVQRLHASSQSAKAMKEHLRVVLEAGADIGTVVQIMPPWLVKAMRWNLRRQAEKTGAGLMGHMTVSNVPGPRRPLYLHHYKLQDWYSIGQINDGSTINCTLWSYCDHANLSILADSKVVPDGWVLYDYFAAELKKLLALVPDRQLEAQA